MDPKRPGRFLLGIECDGATYHSSATARDRDRLRQEVLESLGWTIVRIWSTDWVKDPNAQVERVVAALEQARKAPQKPAISPSRSLPEVRRADEAPVKIVPIANRAEQPESRYDFDKIDDVPGGVIEKLVLAVLASYGATAGDDLKQAVSRQLGFKRTGKNIVARLDLSIESLVRARKLIRVDGDTLKLNGEQGKNYA